MASTKADARPTDVPESSTPTPTTGAPALATSPAASATSAASAMSATSAASASGPSQPKDDYSALAARVASTEAALTALQSQVAQLAAVVKNALPAAANGAGNGGGRVFSPFDSPTPTLPTSGSRTTEGGDIAVLTQQIAALSTSVAQLQRLQTQNIGVGGAAANVGGGGGPGGPNGPQLGMVQTSGLPNGHSHSPHGDPRMYARMSMPPLESPIGGPHVHLSPNREYPGPRTPVNRSFGSSLLNDGMDNGMWGAPGGGKYGGGGNSGPGRDWVPSPGSHMQQQQQGQQQGGGINNPSAAAPGAGIVVTKWEHLQLKAELLRSISKYGYVDCPLPSSHAALARPTRFKPVCFHSCSRARTSLRRPLPRKSASYHSTSSTVV